jgi:hypothetical protein
VKKSGQNSPRPRWTSIGGETGSVLIEFVVVLPLLLLLVLGIFDFGIAFQRYQVLTNAAREGARMAVLPGYSTDDVKARVRSYLTAGGAPGEPDTTVALQTVTPDNGAPFSVWKVSVVLPYTFPLLGSMGGLIDSRLATTTLKATSIMRSEIAAGGG